jgi:hypothetical protein
MKKGKSDGRECRQAVLRTVREDGLSKGGNGFGKKDIG